MKRLLGALAVTASCVFAFNAQAGQPQSGAMQDWIRGERKKARDRQFGLRC